MPWAFSFYLLFHYIYNKVYAKQTEHTKSNQTLKSYFFLLLPYFIFLFVCYSKENLYLCNRKQQQKIFLNQ